MSNAIFPTFVGLKWGIVKTPRWSTNVQRTASMRTLRGSFSSAPVWNFKLQYEFLRQGNAFQEIQQLIGFFNNRKGSFDSFLYTDPDENSVTNQVIATTVAGQTKYKLNKTYGGFTEPVGSINGTPSIFLNGGLQSASLYTLDIDGNLTWNTAPSAGLTLSWTGSYYYRVCFTKDEMEFAEFMQDLWEAKKVEFESVKT